MWIVGTIIALGLIFTVLLDTFETILQPRRVTHRFRLARMFYSRTWRAWSLIARWIRPGKYREAYLGIFGPLSLLALFGVWLLGLILGFALLHWSLRTPMHPPGASSHLISCFYMSGTTFFTLGYGDVTPLGPLGRMLAIVEAGLGFAFLAVVISYLPVLYQAYSHREITISLLDARAGSPPSAAQFLLRIARAGRLDVIERFLAEWEAWAAELLESHLSFPVLSYYRSQHDNQSWLAALTTMLDVCALLLVDLKDTTPYQAQLTFAIARHAAVDLGLVLHAVPHPPLPDRLSPADHQALRDQLHQAGLALQDGPTDARLAELRGIYEPFVCALAERFLFTLPPIVPPSAVADNWQRSAWQPRTPGIGNLPLGRDDGDHFS